MSRRDRRPDAINVDVVGDHAFTRIGDGQRFARRHEIRVWVGGSGGGGRERPPVHVHIGPHTAVACVVGGQAQLAVKHRKGSPAGWHVDHHIVGLASGHEDFALDPGAQRVTFRRSKSNFRK